MLHDIFVNTYIVGRFNPFEKYACQIGSFPEKSGWTSYLSCHHLVTACNTHVFNSLNSNLILPHKAQPKPNLEVAIRSGEPGTPDTKPSLRRNWWPNRCMKWVISGHSSRSLVDLVVNSYPFSGKQGHYVTNPPKKKCIIMGTSIQIII